MIIYLITRLACYISTCSLSCIYLKSLIRIIFLVKSLKFPFESFNINNYVSFSASSATRCIVVKLIHNSSSTNKQRNHYFIRICRLWNSIPLLDLIMPVSIIKNHLKTYLWNHFIANFDSFNIHIFHFLCKGGSVGGAGRARTLPLFQELN